MRNQLFVQSFFLTLIMACSSGCGNVAANSAQQNDPAQGPQQAQAAQLAQVITLATSSPATYSTASGALVPMPSTSLTFAAQAPGLATISFSARGSGESSRSHSLPVVSIKCHVDGQPCQPDSNTVEFLSPQFCCD